ncbi:ABC transporter permease [Sporolactobacillus pectinivorans]|uniref:ABC transporter permease n=1 Tax=Sporolactobacillus pectinivorans TaxID=1591408 RepID=UPI0019604415|nr:ABC transporter permease [Sporolactobacillus pectinivorans]
MPGKKIPLSIINSIMPVILALLIGGIIIAMIGQNPFTTYQVLFQQSLFTPQGLAYTLHGAGPLILTGLAIAITFKANIFNMGVEGQFILGGFIAGIVALYCKALPGGLAQFICLIAGIAGGMLFALIPALLKTYFRVNEMVVTLMLNYAMATVLEFLTTGIFRDNGSGYVTTPMIPKNVMFPRFGDTRITLFFVIAILVFIIMYLVMKKSVLGYETTAMGKNPAFAEATGMRVGNKIVTLMLISGALAGLGGAGYMLSDQYSYTLNFSANPGMGWDGMLVSLLGGHNPVGILVAAIFYSALKNGSQDIDIFTGVPQEIIAVIQSLLILFLSVKFISENTHALDKIRSFFHKKNGMEEE